jgi:hypothetical protein
VIDDSRLWLAPVIAIRVLQTAVARSERDRQYPREANASPAAKKDPEKVLATLRRVDAGSEITKMVLLA